MKHYTVIIKDDSRAVFEHDDKRSAMASFHHEMEYAMNAGITTACIVLNSNGDTVAREKFIAPVSVSSEDGDGE